MTLIPKQQLFIGLEITNESFKIAAIKKKGKRWMIPILEEIPRSDEEKLRKILPRDAILVISLPHHEILIKSLQVPLKRDKDIKAAFEFQAEPLLPFPLEKSLVTYMKTEEKEQGTQLTVFAIKKESLQSQLDLWKAIIPQDIECVTAPSAALTAFSKQCALPDEPFFLIHIGKNEGSASLIEKGALISSRHFEKDKCEMEKSLLALSALMKSKPIETIVLLSKESSWQEVIQKITGKAPLWPSLNNLPISEENIANYALCIGMALGAATKNFPNFRQKEFAICFPWKRLKKSLVSFAFFFLTLLVTTGFLSKAYLEKKEEMVLRKFNAFFTEKPSHNLPELKGRLLEIHKQIQESPEVFPLIPFVPKMGDFISWFSSHFVNNQSNVKIEELRYQMIKRPDFTKKNEHYVVQVEMIFSASHISEAENMRKILSSPNPFVDTKKEIEWTMEKGKYKAIFTLKDKTHYY